MPSLHVVRVLIVVSFVLVAADARAANPRVSLVKDINPGAGDGALPYRGVVNGILYFQGSDGTQGPELWRTDGTAAGTYLVKDLNPGPNGSAPVSFTDLNGVLVFAATTDSTGYELWKSDGTAAGTVMIKDINPGAGSSIVSEPFTSLGMMNGVVYFQAHSDYGPELWRSDGTSAGTYMVKDILPGANGGNAGNTHSQSVRGRERNTVLHSLLAIGGLRPLEDRRHGRGNRGRQGHAVPCRRR